jgi:hypothetical protein
MAGPAEGRCGEVPVVRWPYDARVDSAAAWGVVTAGVAIAGIMVTVLAALDGSHPHFRWWWPTGWMLIPAGITAIGVFMATVPLRNSDNADEDAPGDRQIITASPGSFLLGRRARLKARDIIVVPSPPAPKSEAAQAPDPVGAGWREYMEQVRDISPLEGLLDRDAELVEMAAFVPRSARGAGLSPRGSFRRMSGRGPASGRRPARRPRT